MTGETIGIEFGGRDIAYAKEVARILGRELKKRFNLDSRIVAQGQWRTGGPVLFLEETERRQMTATRQDEGYEIRADQTETGCRVSIRGASVGLLFGVGRLLREIRRIKPKAPRAAPRPAAAVLPLSRRCELPALNIVEHPEVPLRGIFLPTPIWPPHAPKPFNSYSAKYLVEERFDDLEEYLQELMLWGMNTLGLWYTETMALPWDGKEGRQMWERYEKILGVARRLRLKIYLLTTVNLIPLSYIRKYSEPAVKEGPNGCWAKLGPGSALCLSRPKSRRILIESRRRLIELIKPDAVDIFPTDPGGCGCERCTPYWKAYYALAERMLSDAARLGVPLRSINAWYFFNPDVRRLTRAMSASGAVNAVCTQASDREGTRERLAITNRLSSRKKVVLWPDITMIGGWGLTGTYPNAAGLRRLFRLARSPYGVLPYSEGEYDDINKFFMLSLAWNPRLSLRKLVQTVANGAFGETAPEKLIEAILLIEKWNLAAARAKLRTAAARMSREARSSTLWHSLNFFARHGGTSKEADDLKAALGKLRPPLRSTARHSWRRKVRALETRIRAMAKGLPVLAEKVNRFRRPHEIGCGTRPVSEGQLAQQFGLADIKRMLRDLSVRRKGHSKSILNNAMMMEQRCA